MIAVVLSFLVFVVIVMAHLFYCRNHKPNILYAKVFLIMAIIGFALLIILLAELTTGFKLSAALVYVLLIPVYLIFYVTTVLVSPSKKILQIIEADSQIEHEDMLNKLEQEKFIASRLNELVESGCARLENGHYVLTAAGKQTATFINIYQKVLGRPMGG